jgi:hypothetical protein
MYRRLLTRSRRLSTNLRLQQAPLPCKPISEQLGSPVYIPMLMINKVTVHSFTFTHNSIQASFGVRMTGRLSLRTVSPSTSVRMTGRITDCIVVRVGFIL